MFYYEIELFTGSRYTSTQICLKSMVAAELWIHEYIDDHYPKGFVVSIRAI